MHHARDPSIGGRPAGVGERARLVRKGGPLPERFSGPGNKWCRVAGAQGPVNKIAAATLNPLNKRTTPGDLPYGA